MAKYSSASRAGPRRSADPQVKSSDPITVFNGLTRRIHRVKATPSERLGARTGIVQNYPQEWASPVDFISMRLRAGSTGSKRPRLYIRRGDD
jgi:hypothetical protein